MWRQAGTSFIAAALTVAAAFTVVGNTVSTTKDVSFTGAVTLGDATHDVTIGHALNATAGDTSLGGTGQAKVTGGNGLQINTYSGTLATPKIRSFAGSPSGTVPGDIGSLALDTSTPALWVNTDGSTTWKRADSASGGTSTQWVFMDGFDGNLTYDGSTTVLGVVPSGNVYTLTRDVVANNLTINNGVTIAANGFRIFAKGTLTNNGTCSDDGPNASGTSSANGRTIQFFPGGGNGGQPGAASATCPLPYCSTLSAPAVGSGGAASNGSNGTNGTGGGACQGGSGGGGAGAAGQGGSAGAAGGTVSQNTASNGATTIPGWLKGAENEVTTTRLTFGSGGGSGGNGSSLTLGGGGAGGGIVFVAARVLAGSGSYHARGGNGAAGANGGCSGGGGGGGGGGFVVLIYMTATGTWTADANGGTGGGSVTCASGGRGGNGGNGGNCIVVKHNLSGDGT